MVVRHDAHAIANENSFDDGINRRKTLENLVNGALFYTGCSVVFWTTVEMVVYRMQQQIKQSKQHIN